MPFTPKLTYKGKPLVRKDNELYYGCMVRAECFLLAVPAAVPAQGQHTADW